jgi:hypothetical protein
MEKTSLREVRETMFWISDPQGFCDSGFSGPEGCRAAQQYQAFRRLSREYFLREIFEEWPTRLRYRAQKSFMLIGAHAAECIGNEAHRSRATSCEVEDTRNQRAVNVADLTAQELLDLLALKGEGRHVDLGQLTASAKSLGWNRRLRARPDEYTESRGGLSHKCVEKIPRCVLLRQFGRVIDDEAQMTRLPP